MTRVDADLAARVRETYAGGGLTQTEVGRLFGLSQSHVSGIVRRMSWSDESQRGSLEQRFWRHVDRRVDNECWEWRGARNPGGYGVIGRGSRAEGTVLAHRVAVELTRGPIAASLHIDHLCRNRGCVNPAHLEPVTQAENNRRAWRARHARSAAA